MITDAGIAEIAELLSRIQREQLEWSDLTERERALMDLHFSVSVG